MSHAKLSPSAAKYWVPCTASIAYIEAGKKASLIPEDDSTVYSREGDTAHEWAAKVNNELIRIEEVPEIFRPHVKLFCDECERLYDIYNEVRPGVEYCIVEEQCPLFYSPKETGTIDFGFAGVEIGVHILDFKYGKGVYVEANENLQLAIYANSVRCDIERKSKVGLRFKDSLPVTMTIAQPRYLGVMPIRQWMTTVGDLKDFCLKIADSVLDIETNDPKRVKFEPHEDTCQFCPARFIPCVHKAMAAFSIVPKLSNPLSMLPDLAAPTVVEIDRLTDAQLVNIKRYGPLLVQFIKDAEANLLRRALVDPANLPKGLKWVRGREGNREWIDEAKTLHFLRKRLDHDQCAPRKLISPAVAKTMLPGLPKPAQKEMNDLIFRAPGKEVLAIAEDKRDEITPGASVESKDISALNNLPDLSEVE